MNNTRTGIKEASRIVVKVGTSSLVYQNGEINLKFIDQLSFTLADLTNRGYEIILVSSGAIGVGLQKLGMNKRPATIPEQQAIAAIGQLELMKLYSQRFQYYNQQSAQVLLTRDIVEFPESRKNVINTFNQLLLMKTVAVVNENDSVAVEELDHLTKFGDNDKLSAIVANLMEADLLIMLSDIEGFFSDNPYTNPNAKLHPHVREITDKHYRMADSSNSRFGTGGMLSKLVAANLVMQNNSRMLLASGKDPTVIFDLLEGKEIGTYFAKDA